MQKLIIAQVIKINEKYDEIRKIKGEDFNIFSILKLERNEVQTHSNFIFELLNHRGSHNQERLFLKLFLEKVLRLTDYGDIKKAEAFQESFTSEKRRIDFVIKTEKYQIGIEMKIDATDQNNQLKDYMNELKKAKGKEPKLYYLTLTGYEASEESTGGGEGKKVEYSLVSFENDIYNWITTCIEKSATMPLLREGLSHYKNLVAKITNKISQPMEKEMEELINTPKEIKAVQTLLNEYPRIWAKKEMEFWDELWERLEEKLTTSYKKYNFEPIDFISLWRDEKGAEALEDIVLQNIIDIRNKKEHWAGFSIDKEYEDIGSLALRIVEWDKDIELVISFDNINEEEVMSEKLDNICKNMDFTGIRKNRRYLKINEEITFYGRYQTNPTYDLFDENRFEYYVNTTFKEVVNKIDLLMKNEKAIKKALSE